MNKQHILDEIKRTAVANGGTPLGKQKFYRDIGIKEADWHGKYWARWGDALREAGFRPNEMQTAYADNLLIERLIDLIREVGRFPVIGELKLKARTDRTFPSHNVFARLGSKQQLAGRVFKYCTDHDGLDDVIALCTSIVHAQANIPQVEEAVSDRQSDAIARTKEGYVYMALLTLGREKRYKIGKAVWSNVALIRSHSKCQRILSWFTPFGLTMHTESKNIGTDDLQPSGQRANGFRCLAKT